MPVGAIPRRVNQGRPKLSTAADRRVARAGRSAVRATGLVEETQEREAMIWPLPSPLFLPPDTEAGIFRLAQRSPRAMRAGRRLVASLAGERGVAAFRSLVRC